jgi:hypothetical protein
MLRDGCAPLRMMSFACGTSEVNFPTVNAASSSGLVLKLISIQFQTPFWPLRVL